MAAQDKGTAAKKTLQKSYFDVLGLCCSSEVPLVENILKSLDGVKDYSVIIPTRTVIVIHDNLLISQQQIVKALNQARLEANVRAYGGNQHQKKWPSPFVMASGVLLVVSLFKYLYHPLRWVALGAVAVGIAPILLKAAASVRNLRLDTNVLVLIAVVGTIAMNDYIEAATIVFLFTIAEWLESRASHKARAVMASLMSIAPQKAVIAETGEEVDVDEVKLNTVVGVRAGEVIPIDGIVVDGNCEVDEKTLTGESFPVSKQTDSTVWAGTINLNGYIRVKTTALAEDCVVAKMAKLVEDAQNSKTKTQRFIDRCAQYYTPAVILLSASLAVVPLALKVHNRNQWFRLALVVLVSACPCALILSTPVATFCALTKAATTGLLIKGGEYLESLAKIKAMAFDKTGTITRGEFVVTHFQSLCHHVNLETLLYWVSSIESKSSHPMAAALVDYGRSLSIQPQPENVTEFQNFPGEGIHGKIDGEDIYIGNKRVALRAGSGAVPMLDPETTRGKTIGYVFCGATPAGIFSLSDACRTGVVEAIRELKLLGVKTAMLTGDSEAAAMHVQEQLEHALELVQAELLPEDKATIIKNLKKEGPTAMIGDGINDAPALATADIGISMGISGSALATETGHVILMSNDIRKIPKAIQLARKAHRKVIENVILSIATKTAILCLAIAGHPLVWAAVLTDVGTCLLVIFNSMLLLRHTHNHARKCCKSSAAQHNHKHGIENSSHTHNNCCSNQTAVEVCKAQGESCTSKCQSTHLSVNSCTNNKCTDAAARQYEHIGANEFHEAKHCGDEGCCDVESNIPHYQDCSSPHKLDSCTNHKCENVLESEDASIEEDGPEGVTHCHHLHDETTSDCHRNAKLPRLSADLEDQKTINGGNCHSNHCGEDDHANIHKNESLGEIVGLESSCHHEHQQKHQADVDKCCKGHCHRRKKRNYIPGEHHTEARGRHACISLENREIGGCCKSYMKECCGQRGHFATGFRPTLSEIVITEV